MEINPTRATTRMCELLVGLPDATVFPVDDQPELSIVVRIESRVDAAGANFRGGVDFVDLVRGHGSRSQPGDLEPEGNRIMSTTTGSNQPRRVLLFAHSTIDGFMGGPNGELDWIVHDEELDNDFVADLIRTCDTILTGRATYQSFEVFWPERAANPDQGYTPREGGQSPTERELAQWMVTTPMVVFTDTLKSFEMANARRAERDIVAEVTALKAQPGKNMVIFGGASTVGTLVAEGLIDEYWLKVAPVAIGTGLPIFDKLPAKQTLSLNWSKAYDSGTIGLRYTAMR